MPLTLGEHDESREQLSNDPYLAFLNEILAKVPSNSDRIEKWKMLYASDPGSALILLKNRCIQRLYPREFFILKERYGLFESAGNIKTSREVGKHLGSGTGLAQSREEKALRKMADPEAWKDEFTVSDNITELEDPSERFRIKKPIERSDHQQKLFELSQSATYSGELRTLLAALSSNHGEAYEHRRIYHYCSQKTLLALSSEERYTLLLIRSYWPAPRDYFENQIQAVEKLLGRLPASEQTLLRRYYGLGQESSPEGARSKELITAEKNLRSVAQETYEKQLEQAAQEERTKTRNAIEDAIKRLGPRIEAVEEDVRRIETLVSRMEDTLSPELGSKILELSERMRQIASFKKSGQE